MALIFRLVIRLGRTATPTTTTIVIAPMMTIRFIKIAFRASRSAKPLASHPALFILHFALCNLHLTYGAYFDTSALQAPWPAAPTAATRNQYFVPLVMVLTSPLDLVLVNAAIHTNVA